VGACADGGTVALELEGGATAGGAATRVAARPLLAAMGAVAQVPTQCSGAGGAALAIVAVVSASSRRVENEARRMDVVTARVNLRENFFSGSILRWFCRRVLRWAWVTGGLSRIVGGAETLTVARSTLTVRRTSRAHRTDNVQHKEE
jgi:hypothetical protein